jgi:hypothetical protein
MKALSPSHNGLRTRPSPLPKITNQLFAFAYFSCFTFFTSLASHDCVTCLFPPLGAAALGLPCTSGSKRAPPCLHLPEETGCLLLTPTHPPPPHTHAPTPCPPRPPRSCLSPKLVELLLVELTMARSPWVTDVVTSSTTVTLSPTSLDSLHPKRMPQVSSFPCPANVRSPVS